MIKVNLLRDNTVVGAKKDGTYATGFGEATSFGGQSDSKALVGKVIVFLLPLIGAFGGLMFQEEEKNQELAKIQQVVTSKTTEVESLKGAIEAVQNFRKEKDRLQVQINTIKALSKERLRNVKALEALQGLVPEKAWLTSLKIQENRAEFQGRATDDKVVADFMAALEENIYFVGVRLKRSSEQADQQGVVKVFEVEAGMEGL